MKKILFMMCLFVGLTGCDNDGKNDTLLEPTERFSGCLRETRGAFEPESCRLSLQDGKFTFYHYNLLVNCAALDCYVSIEVKGDELIISEKEIGDPLANCICPVNVKFVAHDLKHQVYKVKIIYNIFTRAEFTWDARKNCDDTKEMES